MSRSLANWLLYTPFGLAYIFLVRPHLADGSFLNDLLQDAGGLLIILAGLGIRILARQQKTSHLPSGLVTTGPYALIRNPMYVGSYLVGLGMCVVIGHLPFLIAFSIVYWLVHVMVVRQEERFLTKLWPEEYAAYCKSVPAWIPTPNSLARYLRARGRMSPRSAVMRELNTIAGALMGTTMLMAAEPDHARAGIFIGLSGVFFVLWVAALLRPVKSYLRGDG